MHSGNIQGHCQVLGKWTKKACVPVLGDLERLTQKWKITIQRVEHHVRERYRVLGHMEEGDLCPPSSKNVKCMRRNKKYELEST